MNRLALLVLAFVFCLGLALPMHAQNAIVKSIYLVDAYNRGTLEADGFHLVLKGVFASDITTDGYYDNGYLLHNIWEGSDGVHIDWSYGSTPVGQYDTFGFTVSGPVTFSGCQMYFTSGSTTVWTSDDVWQDWGLSSTSVAASVNNRVGARRYIKRTGGRASYSMDINTLVGLATSPLPITIDSAITAIDTGTPKNFDFSSYPGYRSYLMYYDEYAYVSSAYQERARFRTAAVLSPAALRFTSNVSIADHYWWASNSDPNDEMLSFTVTAGGGDDVVWRTLTLQPSGFGDDSTSILSINVWLDSNGNGVVDGTDQLIGTGSYWGDDYPTTIFLSNPPDIPASGSVKAIVAYSMSSAAWPGADFQCAMIDATGTGGVSGADAAIAGLPLTSGRTIMVGNPVSIADVKLQQPDYIAQTFLNDKIVTGYFSGSGADSCDIVYVEEDNRSSGIGIVIPSTGTPATTVGSRISVNGVALSGYSELKLFADSLSQSTTPGATLKPVCMPNRITGGGAFGLQPAVVDNALATPPAESVYLNNVGLLVRIAGTVTGSGQINWNGAGRNVVWIDDGSGLVDGWTTLTSQPSRGIAVLLPAGMATPAGGARLAATGIMSAATGGVRLLLPRTSADLIQY